MKKLLLAFAILGFVACGEGETKTEEKVDSSATAPAATTVDSTKTTDSSSVAADSSKSTTATPSKDSSKTGK